MGNSNKGAIIAIVVVVALIIAGVVAYFMLAKEPAAAPEVSETIRMYEISEDQFEKEVMKATEKRVIVYFYANWCGPCKTTTPILEETSKEFLDYKFVKINGDKAEDLCLKEDIYSFPQILVFYKGKELRRRVGSFDKTQLIEFINH